MKFLPKIAWLLSILCIVAITQNCLAQGSEKNDDAFARAEALAATDKKQEAADLLAKVYRESGSAEDSMTALNLALRYYAELQQFQTFKNLVESSIDTINPSSIRPCLKANDRETRAWCGRTISALRKQRLQENLDRMEAIARTNATQYELILLATLTVIGLFSYRLMCMKNS